jgi:vacuolar-type H+-ATPase subunit I/STV1
MRALLMSHSGLRYLVLVALVALAAYCLYGLLTKKPAGRPLRILGAVFVGLLDVQLLLGLVLVAMGAWYPALAGHLAMMLGAAVVAHVTLAVNRRRPVPGYAIPLGGAVGAALLIVGGVMAIRCGPLSMGCGMFVRAAVGS